MKVDILPSREEARSALFPIPGISVVVPWLCWCRYQNRSRDLCRRCLTAARACQHGRCLLWWGRCASSPLWERREVGVVIVVFADFDDLNFDISFDPDFSLGLNSPYRGTPRLQSLAANWRLRRGGGGREAIRGGASALHETGEEQTIAKIRKDGRHMHAKFSIRSACLRTWMQGQLAENFLQQTTGYRGRRALLKA